ncbi:MAG: diadenylate cyclase CdaA [Dehalococcoidia bacterium]
MPQAPESIRTYLDTLRHVSLPGVVDILLIALMLYAVLLWLKGTTGMSLVRGAAVVIVAGIALGSLLNLTVVNWVLANSVPALLVAVPIVFQPEIRRALERLGRARVAARRRSRASERLLATLAQAAVELSGMRLGGLVVIERETGLDDYMLSGTPVDAVVSAQLVVNLFWRNAPLHDGAVIVRENRIAAAGCTLPLSEAALPGHLGTRHRAALGISERTDAVVIVVSEETGGVSIVVNGQFMQGLDEERLLMSLRSLTGQTEAPPLRLIRDRDGAYERERPFEPEPARRVRPG